MYQTYIIALLLIFYSYKPQKIGFSTGSPWSSSGSNIGFFISIHEKSLWGVKLTGNVEERLESFESGDFLTVIKDEHGIAFQRLLFYK